MHSGLKESLQGHRLEQSPNTQAVTNGQTLNWLMHELQTHMYRFGYDLVSTPIIENADLFLTKAGDRVVESLFTFERHGHLLALRPEFTAAAAHRYLLEQRDQPVRWQFSGPVFADNPRSSGQSYQRQSAGAELLGLDGPAAEAEAIAMAAQGISALGIDDWSLVIGHVGLTRHLLTHFNLDPRTLHFLLNRRDEILAADSQSLYDLLSNYLTTPGSNGSVPISQADARQMLDLLLNSSRGGQTMGGRTRQDIARRLLRKRQQAAQVDEINDALAFLRRWMQIELPPDEAFDAIAPFVDGDPTAMQIVVEWQQLLSMLVEYDIPISRIVIRPDLVRTWDYYSGPVFEIQTQSGESLAGGGRYDELTRLIGGDVRVPSVGFAYELEPIIARIPRVPGQPQRLFFLLTDDINRVEAIRWGNALRKRGVCLQITADIERTNRSAVVLHLSAEGTLRLGQRAYSQNEIDNLVRTLLGR